MTYPSIHPLIVDPSFSGWFFFKDGFRMRDTQTLQNPTFFFWFLYDFQDGFPENDQSIQKIHPKDSFLIPFATSFAQNYPQLFLSLLDVAVLHHLCSLWWWRVARSPRKRSLPLVKKSWRRWGFLGRFVLVGVVCPHTPARLRPVPTGGNDNRHKVRIYKSSQTYHFYPFFILSVLAQQEKNTKTVPASTSLSWIAWNNLAAHFPK